MEFHWRYFIYLKNYRHELLNKFFYQTICLFTDMLWQTAYPICACFLLSMPNIINVDRCNFVTSPALETHIARFYIVIKIFHMELQIHWRFQTTLFVCFLNLLALFHKVWRTVFLILHKTSLQWRGLKYRSYWI